MEIDHPCARDACKCMVAESGKYCSDHCRETDKARDIGTRDSECRCGHDRCAPGDDAADRPK